MVQFIINKHVFYIYDNIIDKIQNLENKKRLY